MASRLSATCCYDYVFTAPTTSLVDGTGYGSSGSPNDQPGGVRYTVFDPEIDIPPSMIMSLLSSKGVSWRDAVEVYFQTTNRWLSAVHQDRFLQKLENLGPSDHPRDAELALLVVCMHLVTQYADSGRPTMPDGTEMLSLSTYVVAKRIHGVLRALGSPRIEIVQSAALLSLFEFGHGDFERAYVTVGDAYTTAKFLDIRPGKYREMERDRPVYPEEDENRDLYWALLIVDRYASQLLIPDFY